MSTEQERNKAVVMRYIEAFNAGDLDAQREIFAPDAVIQGVLGKGGLDFVFPIWTALHEGLGAHMTVVEAVAEGDVVAVRIDERGTFKAPFLGQEPTGRSYELVAMEWFRLRDGRIVERWGARDSASQRKQLGMD